MALRHIIPSVTMDKLYLIRMMINEHKTCREWMDEVFKNSAYHDFGIYKSPRGTEKPARMWGNQTIKRGKRVDAFYERMLSEIALDETDSSNIQYVDGMVIQPENPDNVPTYEVRGWHRKFPWVGMTYMQYPDPKTGKKIIDIDSEELLNHDAKLGEKFMNTKKFIAEFFMMNKLVPRAKIPDFLEIILEMSDVVKSNLGLPDSTPSFYTGGGIHVYTKFDSDKIAEWTGRATKEKPLICGSNSYYRWVRAPGSYNMGRHGQTSFPLFGWDDIGKAFAMSNPTFFMLRSTSEISRTFNGFASGDKRASSLKLKVLLRDEYNRACVPSSSRIRQYIEYDMKINHYDEYIEASAKVGDSDMKDVLDPIYVYGLMRKVQSQYALPFEQIADICGVKI